MTDNLFCNPEENANAASQASGSAISENSENSGNSENTTESESMASQASEPQETKEPELDKACLEKAVYMILKLGMDGEKCKRELGRQGFDHNQIALCVEKVNNLRGVMQARAQEIKESEEQEESKDASKTIFLGIAITVGCVLLFLVLFWFGLLWKGVFIVTIFGLYLICKGIYYKVKGLMKK